MEILSLTPITGTDSLIFKSEVFHYTVSLPPGLSQDHTVW